MHDFPEIIADVTADWLTHAMQSSGLLHENTIRECTVTPFGQERGFASQIARISARYAKPDDNLPTSLIVKLSASNKDAVRAMTLIEKDRAEAAFYRQIGMNVGIRVPRCYFVGHQSSPERTVLLLEDLQSAQFGDAEHGCSIAEAERVLDALATMHAKWWNHPRLSDFDWLPRFGMIEERLSAFPERRTRFLQRHGEVLPTEILRFTQQIDTGLTAILKRVEGPPETLLHVDTHLDNIAFQVKESETEAILFDWQGVSKGLCTVDVALFLSGSLQDDDRGAENQLLERYYNRLVAGGVDDYAQSRFRDDYRIALLRWWIGTVGGLGTAYAGTWTGRQADLARQSAIRWCGLISQHQLDQLV